MEAYATEIALWRTEAIERHMRENPDEYPDYARYQKDIDREREALIQKLGGSPLALEPLIRAHMSYQMEVVLEIYKQAALDGGRVHRAFTERELPGKEDSD